MSAEEQAFFDALPVTGEIAYEDLYSQLHGQGKGGLTRHFHKLSRSGSITVRTERTPGGLKLYVSRPVVEPVE